MGWPGPALTANLREAVRGLCGARLRTVLGLIGIMIGIASVIAMISTGEIASAESRKQFQALGTDILAISASDDDMTADRRRQIGIALEDALELADAVPTIAEAATRIRSHATVRHAGSRAGSGPLQGVTASFAKINKLRVEEGRFVSDMDVGRAYAVVGADIAAAMRRRGPGDVVGRILEIDGRLLTVAGALADTPESYALPFQVSANASVFLPITTLRRMLPQQEVDLIVARVAAGVPHADAAGDVQAFFAERTHGLAVDVVSAEQLIERMESQLGLMTLLLGAVGSISLVVGGIGVMNVMLISVAERRREIGVRRALGASRADIQLQFLIEALILTLAGGIAGIVVGTAVTYGICRITGWEFFISPLSLLSGIGVSCAVGVFFGFQPAHRASRLDPIVALRGT